MKTEIPIHTNAIKKITAAVLGWLCIAAWLAAVVYSRLRLNFRSAELGGIEVPQAFTKAQRCTNEQRFRRVQEADRGLGARPRRRETDGESFDSQQAAARARLRIDGIDFEIDRLCVAAIKKAKILS